MSNKIIQPAYRDHQTARCRDCAESAKQRQLSGNSIKCKMHQVPVCHSARCDGWHAKGTLL